MRHALVLSLLLSAGLTAEAIASPSLVKVESRELGVSVGAPAGWGVAHLMGMLILSPRRGDSREVNVRSWKGVSAAEILARDAPGAAEIRCRRYTCVQSDKLTEIIVPARGGVLVAVEFRGSRAQLDALGGLSLLASIARSAHLPHPSTRDALDLIGGGIPEIIVAPAR
jgi:hypothetical protein